VECAESPGLGCVTEQCARYRPEEGFGRRTLDISELDAAFECCDGTNRDRDLPPTPQMPLLKEYMGHKMRQTFDDEPLDRSYFAIRRMHAIASVNPDLTGGVRHGSRPVPYRLRRVRRRDPGRSRAKVSVSFGV